MRSRIRWALLAVGAALNASGVMDFSLRHSRNRVLLKTRTATLTKHFVIRRASRKGIPPRPANIKASREVGGAHCGLDRGISLGVDGRGQTASDGIRTMDVSTGQRISPVVQYRITPIKN
jgi:hypothetical protein